MNEAERRGNDVDFSRQNDQMKSKWENKKKHTREEKVSKRHKKTSANAIQFLFSVGVAVVHSISMAINEIQFLKAGTAFKVEVVQCARTYSDTASVWVLYSKFLEHTRFRDMRLLAYYVIHINSPWQSIILCMLCALNKKHHENLHSTFVLK